VSLPLPAAGNIVLLLCRAASFERTGRRRSCKISDVEETMKIKNSLKALKLRNRNNRMVRRKGRIYIINKLAPRFKARQG